MPKTDENRAALADAFRTWRGGLKLRLLEALEQLAYDVSGLPMALPFGRPELPGEAKNATLLHDFYRRHFWRKASGPPRALFAALLWPIGLAFTIVQNTMRNGQAARRQSGKSAARQMAEQASVAWRHSIAPPWYYMFELHGEARGARAGEYLTAHETIAGCYDLFEPDPPQDDLGDKVWFAEHCQERGIKAVPVLFHVSKGRTHFLRAEDDPAFDADLFVKPRSGSGGHRAERWDRTGDGLYRNSRGETLSRQALLVRLEEQSLSRGFIVQPRLINHPALDDISNGALSTIRVLTIPDEQGRCVATNVAFRMAIGTNSVVDNFHQGGLAAPVDMATGKIGLASDIGRYPDVGWRERHPVSGALFAGRELPYWREAIALACEAGAAFPWRKAIGWDVALLKDGPMIVEGNGKPDLDIHQRCERRPLGRERIAALLAYHVVRMSSTEGTART